MLTALDSEADAVQGLEAGADDYVTKPFGLAELRSRIRAVLRRAQGRVVEGSLRVGPVMLDRELRRVDGRRRRRSGSRSASSSCSRCLMSRPGYAFNRQELLRAIWGDSAYRDPRAIDVHIRHLREKLEPHARGAEPDPHRPRHGLPLPRGMIRRLAAARPARAAAARAACSRARSRSRSPPRSCSARCSSGCATRARRACAAAVVARGRPRPRRGRSSRRRTRASTASIDARRRPSRELSDRTDGRVLVTDLALTRAADARSTARLPLRHGDRGAPPRERAAARDPRCSASARTDGQTQSAATSSTVAHRRSTTGRATVAGVVVAQRRLTEVTHRGRAGAQRAAGRRGDRPRGRDRARPRALQHAAAPARRACARPRCASRARARTRPRRATTAATRSATSPARWRRMQEELRRQEAARRSFVSTASHELRTPLTMLQGTMELLEEDLRDGRVDLDDAQRQVANARGASCGGCRCWPSELLDLSRLDAAVPAALRAGRARRARARGRRRVRAARAASAASRIDACRPPGPAGAAATPTPSRASCASCIDNALRYGAARRAGRGQRGARDERRARRRGRRPRPGRPARGARAHLRALPPRRGRRLGERLRARPGDRARAGRAHGRRRSRSPTAYGARRALRAHACRAAATFTRHRRPHRIRPRRR